jgi:hypothetical protein
VRIVMEAARVKRKGTGERGRDIEGIEAARTVTGVLRHMYSRAMEEVTQLGSPTPSKLF